ncbi:hypothetical protein K2P97_04490 [bacterium]|nr:hypothetical protein [bacterium]
MQEFLVTILLGLSTLLGIKTIPEQSPFWNIETQWVQNNKTWEFKASTTRVSEICNNSTESLVFPQVVHGIHKIWSDDQLIVQTGDDTFQKTSPFYGRTSVSCALLAKTKVLTWEVKTYSQYFARISHLPDISHSPAKNYFFDVVLNVVSAGALLVLALFSLFIFSGKIESRYVFSLAVGSACFAIYGAMTSANLLGITLDMFTAHKIADVCVWLGSFCYVYFFRKFKYLGKIEFSMFFVAFIVAQALIIFGSSPDVVQLGTTLPIPFAFVCLTSFLVHSLHDSWKSGLKKHNTFGIVSIALFVFSAMNDLFHITGLIDSYMIMPIGSVFGVFFLAVSVNQDIEKTYVERDDLLKNLQSKVDEQTQHLSSALDQVKKSQADLVQSARLASLGTLSAGIAHEINNAINFVNGAVVPLERKVLKHIPEEDKVIVNKLFEAVKQGTHLTVEIVRGLRNFTGLNQSKIKDVSVKAVVDTVLVILKSKLNAVHVELDIEEDATLTCYQVGLNQIIMNIVSNAIDVLPAENAKIKIAAHALNSELVEIRISDNGKGMSSETQTRIFDPFFTTKEVGKGTGLGLHIVLKEVEKHNGKIKVKSALGEGTEFIIELPRSFENIQSEAA